MLANFKFLNREPHFCKCTFIVHNILTLFIQSFFYKPIIFLIRQIKKNESLQFDLCCETNCGIIKNTINKKILKSSV